MIQVTVPATSANLGVGYDCLGLAVNIYGSFDFQHSEESLVITGCPTKFQNEDNIVYRSFVRGCQALNQAVPNVAININTDVPVSRGLGSSATCIVAGLIGAGAWFQQPFSDAQLLDLATEIEGHPDNVAPAIYGGLCMATRDQDGQLQIVKYPVHDSWQLLAIIPDFAINTKKARAVLPTEMSYADATYQISHALLMLTAMQNGNLSLLKEGLIDKMQQPYREQLIPHFDTVKTIIDQHDSAYYVSGSGSTIMVITNHDDTRKQIQQKIKKSFPAWDTINVKIDAKGATREMISD